MKTETPYWKKLQDPRWQKMRLEILERDNWACAQCGETEVSLHVHHKFYWSKQDPWAYPPQALMTLCENCHEAAAGQISLFDNEWKLAFDPWQLELIASIPSLLIKGHKLDSNLSLLLLHELVSDSSMIRLLLARRLAKLGKDGSDSDSIKSYLSDEMEDV